MSEPKYNPVQAWGMPDLNKDEIDPEEAWRRLVCGLKFLRDMAASFKGSGDGAEPDDLNTVGQVAEIQMRSMAQAVSDLLDEPLFRDEFDRPLDDLDQPPQEDA